MYLEIVYFMEGNNCEERYADLKPRGYNCFWNDLFSFRIKICATDNKKLCTCIDCVHYNFILPLQNPGSARGVEFCGAESGLQISESGSPTWTLESQQNVTLGVEKLQCSLTCPNTVGRKTAEHKTLPQPNSRKRKLCSDSLDSAAGETHSAGTWFS